jgi:hypothetical protein
LFCLLCCLSGCRSALSSDDAQETNNLKAVIQKCCELIDDGKLPGVSKDDHGELNGYQLTDSIKKDLIDKKIIPDVEGYRDAYVIDIKTKDNRNYKYFFSIENGNVVLISSYYWENGGWGKIHGSTA